MFWEFSKCNNVQHPEVVTPGMVKVLPMPYGFLEAWTLRMTCRRTQSTWGNIWPAVRNVRPTSPRPAAAYKTLFRDELVEAACWENSTKPFCKGGREGKDVI